jgi:uncharacterized protein YtpQ (UPF0354 family)
MPPETATGSEGKKSWEAMPLFEHPLQLFTLDYPDNWTARYQEETGGVIFVHEHEEDAGALSISPRAVTGADYPVAEELLQAAHRLEVRVAPADVQVIEHEGVHTAYAEGKRESTGSHGSILTAGARLRFWVLRHGPLALHVVQLGPGVEREAQREAADAALRSLAFPEIFPPTPHEFRARVLEILNREYPQLRPAARGEWTIEVTDEQGEPRGTIALENLYRSCLLNAESMGALIRDYLDEVFDSIQEESDYSSYESVRGRLLPMLKPEDWVREVSERLEILGAEFAPGLWICFAIDEPARLAYVTRELLEQWDVPLERIQEVAQDNLAAGNRELEMALLPGEDNRPYALVINTQDGYDAARLVLPGVREAFAEELGDEYLVGIPNRDFLIAFSQRDPEMTAAIIRQIKQDYHRMDHPLTPTVYRVRADTVEATEL